MELHKTSRFGDDDEDDDYDGYGQSEKSKFLTSEEDEVRHLSVDGSLTIHQTLKLLLADDYGSSPERHYLVFVDRTKRYVVSPYAGEEASLEHIDSTLWRSVKLRLPWLMLNLLTACFSSWVIGNFQHIISAYTLLAVIMPTISGQSGNAGSQTMSVAVRAVAIGELNAKTLMPALGKEIQAAVVNGCAVGLSVAAVVYAIHRHFLVSVACVVAMILDFVVGQIFGLLITYGLAKMGTDPALGSGIFTTALTDSCGFFFFLGMCTLFLDPEPQTIIDNFRDYLAPGLQTNMTIDS